MATKRTRVVQLTDAVQQLPGKWVAIKDGKVVEAGATPDQVVAALQRRDITGAYVTRLPAEDDKELVGLG